jgi:hypothetical protein
MFSHSIVTGLEVVKAGWVTVGPHSGDRSSVRCDLRLSLSDLHPASAVVDNSQSIPEGQDVHSRSLSNWLAPEGLGSPKQKSPRRRRSNAD